MKNRFLVFLLLFAFICNAGAIAYARYTNFSMIAAGVSFSGTTATVTARARGYTDVIRIAGTLTLERQISSNRWETVQTWTDVAVNGYNLRYEATTTVSPGTYRATFSASASTATDIEFASASHIGVCS